MDRRGTVWTVVAPMVTFEPQGKPQGTWRTQLLVLAVLIALVVLLQAVVSSNDNPGYIPSDEELVAAHIESETVTPAVARCFVAELTDQWSPADKRAIVSGDMEYSGWRVSSWRYIAAGKRCGVPRYLND